uniref:HAT C-terminal dimerisation domain-containing protein n=1 Tax=Acanthochromis polyacanthus TaxID=80966 RepID=A0A3Q1HRY1_9TELE
MNEEKVPEPRHPPIEMCLQQQRPKAKEPLKPPPRSLKADVLKHFGFYCQPGPGNKKALNMMYAVCRHCYGKVKYFGNTTNARVHMDRHHPELLKEEMGRPTKAPTAGQRTLHHFERFPKHSEQAKKITRAIAVIIVKDLHPYSTVEREGFRHLVHTLEPCYRIPHRVTFSNTVIPQLYKETKLKVREGLIKANRVVLTCDHWTSRTTESYGTFTVHYITDEWELQSLVLQTRAMHESHTAANVNETFHSVAEEWGLTLSDCVIVTDNAANMLAAMQLNDLTHVTCFALLGRIRRIVRYFHRSAVAAEALKASQKECIPLVVNVLYCLIIDISTRWNSAHDMVERFLEQLPAGSAALVSPEVRRNNTADSSALNDAEIHCAEEIVETLKPFKEATKAVSEARTPTLSIIAPMHHHLLQSTEMDKEDSPLVWDAKCAMHDDLTKRYNSAKTKSKHLLHMASGLDPRFKALPFLAEEERSDVHARLITEAATLDVKLTYLLIHIFITYLCEQYIYVENYVRAPPKSPRTRAEEEMKKYLEEPPLSLEVHPLDWWKLKERDFRLLAKLAKRILCIPGTSVAAERVFSTAGDIVID